MEDWAEARESGCDDDWAEEEGGDVDGADDDVVGPLDTSREIKEGAELLGSEDDKGGNIQWPSRSKPKGQVTVEDAGVVVVDKEKNKAPPTRVWSEGGGCRDRGESRPQPR